jgi:hypothetical protein
MPPAKRLQAASGRAFGIIELNHFETAARIPGS